MNRAIASALQKLRLAGAPDETAEQHKKLDEIMATRHGRRAVDRWHRTQIRKGMPRTAASIRPSAREWFPYLLDRLMASRPVIGEDDRGLPIFGAPTFRNVIDEHGEHV